MWLQIENLDRFVIQQASLCKHIHKSITQVHTNTSI